MGFLGFGKKVPPEVTAAVLDYMETTTALLARQDVVAEHWDNALSAALEGAQTEEDVYRHLDSLLEAAERLVAHADTLVEDTHSVEVPDEARAAHRALTLTHELYQTWAHEQLRSYQARKNDDEAYDHERVRRAYVLIEPRMASQRVEERRLLKDAKVSRVEQEGLLAGALRARQEAIRDFEAEQSD